MCDVTQPAKFIKSYRARNIDEVRRALSSVIYLRPFQLQPLERRPTTLKPPPTEMDTARRGGQVARSLLNRSYTQKALLLFPAA